MHFSDHCVPFQTPGHAEQTGQETNIRRTSPRIHKAAAMTDKQTPQLPLRSWASGKNRSFHDAGKCLRRPTLCMKAACFIRLAGVVV